MRILIDMQGAQTPVSKMRGVGVYTNEMVKGLLHNLTSDDEVFLILNGVFVDSCDKIKNDFWGLIAQDHIKIWQQYIKIDAEILGHKSEHDVAEYVKEWYMSQFKPDIVWSTNLQEGWLDGNVATGIKRVCRNSIYCSTLHDVTPLIFKDKFLNDTIIGWYMSKIKDAQNSDIILTVSEFSRKEICKLLEVSPEKVFVAANGVNRQRFFPRTRKIDNKEKYVLYVGSGDEHKNLNRLVIAYNSLPSDIKEEYALLLAGSGIKERVCKTARRLNINPKYIVGATDKEIAELMQNCSLFVFPSYAEGFGLPVLEAMASGAPTLTSTETSLPDVISCKEAMFNPFDVQDIAKHMEKVLSDNDFANYLIDRGLKKASEFSWNASSKIILDVFRKVCKEAQKKPETYPIKDLIEDIKRAKIKNKSELMAISQEIADNTVCLGKKRKVYLDLSVVAKRDFATGIQRVVRAITFALMNNKNNDEFEFIPVCSDIGFDNYFRAFFDKNKFTVPEADKRKDYLVDFTDGDILLLLDLHPGNAISKKEYFARLMKRNISVLFVVYDLIPVILEEGYFGKGLKEEFTKWLNIVAESNGILCISQDVSQKFKEWVEENKIKIKRDFYNTYFHLGADVNKSVPSKGLPENYKEVLKNISSKVSILMVSTIEPRKEHQQALHAFELLWEKGYDVNLVFVGRIGWNMENFAQEIRNHKELGKHFIFLEGISDEYLEKIYAASSVVLMASLAEGFGLSIIEGALHHKPLILRDIPVFREVAKDGAFYFNGNDAKDLAKAMEEWIDMYKKDEYPRSNSIEILTWDESAEKLAERLNNYCTAAYY